MSDSVIVKGLLNEVHYVLQWVLHWVAWPVGFVLGFVGTTLSSAATFVETKTPLPTQPS